MFNGDPPLPSVNNLSTEMIQKGASTFEKECQYLEENKELILAALEGQNLGKFAEVAQYQAKLQHNLTYLAKLADAGTQPQTQSQGQSMQHPHVAMSQPQPDTSTLNLPFDMNDQQQQEQQQHPAMSLQQHDLSNSKLPFQMNEQQHKLPTFFQQQQQLISGTMGNFPGTNSGIYQTLPTRLGNMSDTPESSQISSDVGPVWSLGKSPSGPY